MDGHVWAPALAAVGGISLVSLVGAVGMVIKRDFLAKALFVVVAFAAGALLGDAFFHLVPEIAESDTGFDTTASVAILSGVLVLFVLEKVLHWHHAHFPHPEVMHPVAVTNLVGDGLHNFVDGAIVAGGLSGVTQLGGAPPNPAAPPQIPQEG